LMWTQTVATVRSFVKSFNYYSLNIPEPTSSVKTKEKRQYECSSEWVRDILTPQVKYTDEEL
jgi:hypothetical protein